MAPGEITVPFPLWCKQSRDRSFRDVWVMYLAGSGVMIEVGSLLLANFLSEIIINVQLVGSATH